MKFQGGGGIQTKQPALVGVWIFSKTTQCMIVHLLYMYICLKEVSWAITQVLTQRY